jgi:hypothetical protein
MTESQNIQDHMYAGQSTHQTPKGSLTPFPAANDDYRYLRKRATILYAVFNDQPLDVSDKERAQAWNEYASMQTMNDRHVETNHSIVSSDQELQLTMAR